MNTDNNTQEATNSAKTLTTVIYALQASSLFIGFTFFIAIILNYLKKDKVQGTWLESHFRWQIRTFWFSVLWVALGLLGFMILGFLGLVLELGLLGMYIGTFIILANTVWILYRIIKGFLRLNKKQEMYTAS